MSTSTADKLRAISARAAFERRPTEPSAAEIARVAVAMLLREFDGAIGGDRRIYLNDAPDQRRLHDTIAAAVTRAREETAS
jgi:hypothetical protein